MQVIVNLLAFQGREQREVNDGVVVTIAVKDDVIVLRRFCNWNRELIYLHQPKRTGRGRGRGRGSRSKAKVIEGFNDQINQYMEQLKHPIL